MSKCRIMEEHIINCAYCTQKISKDLVYNEKFCSTKCWTLFHNQLSLRRINCDDCQKEILVSPLIDINHICTCNKNFSEFEEKFLLRIFTLYLPFAVKVKQLDFQRNYNGNKFGILNGIYPLYKKTKKYWQGTTNNNSTGQNLNRLQLCLIPIEKINEKENIELSKLIRMLFLFLNEPNNHFNATNYIIQNRIITNALRYIDMQILLENHIDIFGLIQKGYAIDKTLL